MWNTSIPQGKIPYVPKWQLTCILSPVITVDDTVVPGRHLMEFGSDLQDFSGLVVEVRYDDSCLFEGTFTGPEAIVVQQQILDDQAQKDHVLTISLSGKTDDHSCFSQGRSVSLGVGVGLEIEGLPAELLGIVNGLPKIMGENKIYSMAIKTPIYRWLFQNQEYIMNDLRSLYKE